MSPVHKVSRLTEIDLATMADRDILPDTFKPVHYDLAIKDLDFAKWTYNGSVM